MIVFPAFTYSVASRCVFSPTDLCLAREEHPAKAKETETNKTD